MCLGKYVNTVDIRSCSIVQIDGYYYIFAPIVSKGRMIGKKRGTTLDFTMKVIIFVCTLVKVYNMEKKIELIVTVVSITSLYF